MKFNPKILGRYDLEEIQDILMAFDMTFKVYEAIDDSTVNKVVITESIDDDCKVKVVEFYFHDGKPVVVDEFEETYEPTTCEEEEQVGILAEIIRKNKNLIRAIDDHTIIKEAWNTIRVYCRGRDITPASSFGYYYNIVISGKKYRINAANGFCYNERVF